MKSKSFEGMACSIAGVLEAIGDRWAVLILRDLSLGLKQVRGSAPLDGCDQRDLVRSAKAP